MLSENIIEPAQTEWTAPIVFVPRKYRTLGFCADYRKLNAVTKRDSYSIPHMDECIDSFGKATTFLTLDANSRYRQIKIDDTDKDKTCIYIPSWSLSYRTYVIRTPQCTRYFPAYHERDLVQSLMAIRPRLP